MIDPIPYAVPIFIAAIIFEVLWKRRHHHDMYQASDTYTCLATSILSSIVGAYGMGMIVLIYLYIFDRYRLIDMRDYSGMWKLLSLLALIVMQDFIYYWFHRFAHRINFLWASHITHHSSEHYNFAVALRQSSFQQFFSRSMYFPFALMGYPLDWLVFVIGINLIYQFWSHTTEVGRLPGWVEAVFNTPSHHRVHHGTNPQYLDKNYAGIFITWDKLFGTFEPEVEVVRYGITVPLASFNPVWANIHYYWYLCQKSMAAPNIFQAIKLWLAPPDWKPAWLKDEVAVAISAENPAAS